MRESAHAQKQQRNGRRLGAARSRRVSRSTRSRSDERSGAEVVGPRANRVRAAARGTRRKPLPQAHTRQPLSAREQFGMTRAPERRARRAKPLDVAPICAVDQRNRAGVDLEARVAARGVGPRAATWCDRMVCGRQQNGPVTRIGDSRHADGDAPRACPQVVGAWQYFRPVLTKYGQLAHSASPFRARPAGPSRREKRLWGTVVPPVARARGVIGIGGITNAPMETSRLRV